MKTRKTNNGKKSQDTDFLFPCGDFQKMAEMMKNCCPDESGAIGGCSIMMRRMMGHGKGGQAKKEQETQKPPKGGGNG